MIVNTTAGVICSVFGKLALMKLLAWLHYIFWVHRSTCLTIFDPITFLTLLVEKVEWLTLVDHRDRRIKATMLPSHVLDHVCP